MKKDKKKKTKTVSITIYFKDGKQLGFTREGIKHDDNKYIEWFKDFFDWYYNKENDLFLYFYKNGVSILNRNEITFVDIKEVNKDE